MNISTPINNEYDIIKFKDADECDENYEDYEDEDEDEDEDKDNEDKNKNEDKNDEDDDDDDNDDNDEDDDDDDEDGKVTRNTKDKKITKCTDTDIINCTGRYDEMLKNMKNTNMKKIFEFNCSHNNLNFIPDFLNVKLKKLNCCYNKLTSLKSIFYLKSLEFLYCYNNNIKILPLSILSNFKFLKVFDVSNNALSYLPDFVNLVNLEKLAFSRNNITLFPNLKTNIKIKHLDCSKNKIQNISFEHFEYFGYFDYFDCSENLIDNIPQDFSTKCAVFYK